MTKVERSVLSKAVWKGWQTWRASTKVDRKVARKEGKSRTAATKAGSMAHRSVVLKAN